MNGDKFFGIQKEFKDHSLSIPNSLDAVDVNDRKSSVDAKHVSSSPLEKLLFKTYGEMHGANVKKCYAAYKGFTPWLWGNRGKLQIGSSRITDISKDSFLAAVPQSSEVGLIQLQKINIRRPTRQFQSISTPLA